MPRAGDREGEIGGTGDRATGRRENGGRSARDGENRGSGDRGRRPEYSVIRREASPHPPVSQSPDQRLPLRHDRLWKDGDRRAADGATRAGVLRPRSGDGPGAWVPFPPPRPRARLARLPGIGVRPLQALRSKRTWRGSGPLPGISTARPPTSSTARTPARTSTPGWLICFSWQPNGVSTSRRVDAFLLHSGIKRLAQLTPRVLGSLRPRLC